MRVLAVILYFSMGLLQLAAIMGGLESWWRLNSVVAFVLALIISYIPVLGQVVGMAGAVQAWGWEWWQAGLLFFGSFVVTILLGVASEGFERLRSRNI